MTSFTPKQQEILDSIRRAIQTTGRSPTIREIGASVNLRSSCSVHKQLDTLVLLGAIRRNEHKYRSIELMEDHHAEAISKLPTVPVPILGRIAGGAPIDAISDVTPELLALPSSLLPYSDQDRQSAVCSNGKYFEAPLFALVVQGDSMIEAGIADGDLVVARRQHTANNGEIVVALIDGQDATVKRFYKEAGRIRLQPENAEFQATYPEHIEVQGKVTLAIKKF